MRLDEIQVVQKAVGWVACWVDLMVAMTAVSWDMRAVKWVGPWELPLVALKAVN